ncbi:hypothetical protein FACS189452_06840 [Bacteroidia bacterium]|nr:hypothetical protein FACS189452_06840 [Bacteroidia bacterium]
MAQYRINLKIDGAGDSTVYLMRYVERGIEVSDSVRANSKGVAVFTNKTQLLTSGMYIVKAGKLEFPFLVSDPTKFELSVNGNMVDPATLRYSKSKENETFLNYLNLQITYDRKLQEIQQRGQEDEENEAIEVQKNKDIDSLLNEQERFVKTTVANNAGTLLASLITASQEPELPEFDAPDSPNPDSARWRNIVNFAKKHFFDNINFNDNRLINTPVLTTRLAIFFQQILLRESASDIVKSADELLERVKNNKTMYRYVLTWLYTRYNSSPIEGHFAVGKAMTAYMADTTKADWLTPKDKQELEKNIKRYSLNPVGYIASDLLLQTPVGAHKSLHTIEAPYTLLYFFNPGCHSCQETTPQLYSLFQRYKDKGLQVFAVYPDREKEEWVKYINENKYYDFINVWDADETAKIYDKYSLHVIPQIYVLDADKKILYKDVSIEDLQNILFVAFLNK